MDKQEHSSIARDLGEQYRDLLKTENIDLGNGNTALVVPGGRALASLKKLADEYLPKPERRRGTVAALSLASFNDIVARFKSPESVVFAKPDAVLPELTAVFDFHPKGPDTKDAGWLQHRAVYAPKLSLEWLAWKAQDGKFMNQMDFAAFLEEHATNIIVPNLDDPNLKTYGELVQGTYAEPNQLIALSRNLEINVNATVRSAARTSTGEITVNYAETHAGADNQPIRIPNLFVLCIPVFYAGSYVRMVVSLRYRTQPGNGIVWGYLIQNPDAVLQKAFDELVAAAQAANTDVPVFLGTPEK